MKLIVILSLIPYLAIGQGTGNQNKQAAVYNVALGAIVGGVSELIANPRHVKPLKALIHGFCMGGIGGGLNYAGKALSSEVILRGKYGYVLPARLVSSLGSSIIYNTARSSNPYFQYFNFDYGPVQIGADLVNNKLLVKILPGSLIGTVASVADNGCFDVKHSLLMGVACFSTVDTNKLAHGYTYITSITVNKHASFTQERIDTTRAHEFIHVLQAMEYNNISNITLGWCKAYMKSRNPWRFVALDLPYSDGAYLLSGACVRGDKYRDNLFEKEARFFSHQIVETIPLK